MHIVKFTISLFTITENIKFLSMLLDCHLTWKLHWGNIAQKLSLICFMLRKVLLIVNVKMLRMVYFAHFRSKISNGVIFWGPLSSVRNFFVIQEREIRILLRLGPRSVCGEGFKELDVHTVPCFYIYALMLFAVKSPYIYQTNTCVHGMNTRQQNKLLIPLVRLSSIHRGVYYSSVKIFSQLWQNICKFHNSILRLC